MDHPTQSIHRAGVLAPILLTLLALGASACQTARMAVPSPLAESATAMDVAGANPRVWNRPISFGPWQTVEVREGLTWGFGAQFLPVAANFSFQPYRLVLAGADGEMQIECITRELRLSRNGLSVDPTLGRMPALTCGFREADGEIWSMTLRQGAMKLEGKVEPAGGASPWSIRPVHRLEGSRIPGGDPFGYEIVRGEQAVAAVETINRGRVWIGPSLSAKESDRLAAIAAALLLYQPPAND